MAKHAQPDELAKLKGAAKKHPERYRNKVPKSDLLAIGCLARFGMSPSDRTKLGIDKPKDDEDDFE